MRLQANIVENKSRGIVENESLGKSLPKSTRHVTVTYSSNTVHRHFLSKRHVVCCDH